MAAVRETRLDKSRASRVRQLLAEHVSLRLADVDTDRYSLLHALVQYNQPLLVALLFEKGLHGGRSKRAAVTAQDRWGVDALMLAACNGHCECATLLLRHGADPRARDCEGVTALEWARRGSHHDMVRLLQQAMRGDRH